MKSMTVNITPEIIAESVQLDSSKCMIAQALRMRGAMSTNVTAETISFNLGDTRYTYQTPARAAAEVIKFDKDTKSVKPFKFVLDSRYAFARPVIKRPHAKKRGPTTKKTTTSAKRTVRRFHGLRVIEIERGI